MTSARPLYDFEATFKGRALVGIYVCARVYIYVHGDRNYQVRARARRFFGV